MGCEPPGPFITSLLELKLDTNSMFEWQRHSQELADIPHFSKLLEFLNLRAQASETSVSHQRSFPQNGNPSDRRGHHPSRSVTAFTSNTDSSPNCILCGHPPYTCTTLSLSLMRRCCQCWKTTTSVSTASNQVISCVNASHFTIVVNARHHITLCRRWSQRVLNPHHPLAAL